jgi:predicted nuclease of predicted toxin-antitoxin system
MVEPVALLINGRGNRVWRAREVGLEREDDQVLVEYVLSFELVLVTFDRDLRNKARRGGCQVLHIRGPEISARERLADAYEAVRAPLAARQRLVTLHSDGHVSVDA